MNDRTANIAATAPSMFTLADLGATQALAGRIASVLQVGDVIALDGDLGTGKTSFARAVIRTLGDPEMEVPSPTFTLVQTYDLPEFELWHFDLYRLEAPQDALELDIEEAFANAASLIEWPQRLGAFLPADRLDIRFAFADRPEKRTATVTARGRWNARAAALRDG